MKTHIEIISPVRYPLLIRSKIFPIPKSQKLVYQVNDIIQIKLLFPASFFYPFSPVRLSAIISTFKIIEITTLPGDYHRTNSHILKLNQIN